MHRETLLAITLTLCACHGPGDGVEPSYEGCASDENWSLMDDHIRTSRINSDVQTAPQLLEPAEGATLSGGTPAMFRFQPSSSLAGNANGDASCPQFQPSRFGGVRPLHLPPVSGTVFDLQLTVDGTVAHRVLTTRQAAAVPASKWSSWAGKRVSATLYRARMLQNEIVEGPYRAQPREFQLTP